MKVLTFLIFLTVFELTPTVYAKAVGDDEDDDETSDESNSDYIISLVHQVTGRVDSGVEENTLNEDDEDDDDDEYDYYEEDTLDPWEKAYNWEEIKHQTYPLYIFIIGGIRWDLFEKNADYLSSLRYLERYGSKINMMEPVFPAEDYPVWSSLASGQYPDSHSITGDMMYNLRARKMFDRYNETSTADPKWWSEFYPFWATATQHGKKVALYNWHDCELEGKGVTNPEDCKPYERSDGKSHLEKKLGLRQMMDEAFEKLYDKGYHATVVYTDMIRESIEEFGPDSDEVKSVMQDVDDILQTKLIDIRAKGERKNLKMNVMVISDYGFTESDSLEPVFLEDFISMEPIQNVIMNSGYASISPYALEHNKILNDCKKIDAGVKTYLARQLQDPPIYDATILPSNLHYGDAEWAQDILIVAEPGYQLILNSSKKVVHVPGSEIDGPDSDYKVRSGFNPRFVEAVWPFKLWTPRKERKKKQPPHVLKAMRQYELFHRHKFDMNSIGFFMGPDFKVNYELDGEEMEIIDIYQVICFLLRIPLGTHDGEWDRIKGILNINGSAQNSAQFSLMMIPLLFSYCLTRFL